jgi:hypothetical protein
MVRSQDVVLSSFKVSDITVRILTRWKMMAWNVKEGTLVRIVTV